MVFIEFEDNGRGIDKETMATLFDGPKVGQAPGKKTGGGMGIGLSLVKKAVTLFDGKITARPRDPRDNTRGTVFTIELPLLHEDGPGGGGTKR